MSAMSERELRQGLLHGSGGKIEMEESLPEFLRAHGFHDAAEDVRRCLDGMYDDGGGDDLVARFEEATFALSAIEKAAEAEGAAEEKLAAVLKVIKDWNGE